MSANWTADSFCCHQSACNLCACRSSCVCRSHFLMNCGTSWSVSNIRNSCSFLSGSGNGQSFMSIVSPQLQTPDACSKIRLSRSRYRQTSSREFDEERSREINWGSTVGASGRGKDRLSGRNCKERRVCGSACSACWGRHLNLPAFFPALL